MKNKIKNFISSILLNEDALPLFYRNENKKISDIKFNLYSFGNKNKNKIFYVIRRSPGAGLFSNVTFVINHLKICDKYKFIPIIDMENFTTIYNEKNKVENIERDISTLRNEITEIKDLLRSLVNGN